MVFDHPSLTNSPAFALQLERLMEACAWRQPSMSSSRCTLYNHHHYHHILPLPLLPPLACVVTTILLLPKLSHIAWAVTTASTTYTTTITNVATLLSPTWGCRASLKSLLESVRVLIPSYDTYMQLQIDVTFIKQVYNQQLQKSVHYVCIDT